MGEGGGGGGRQREEEGGRGRRRSASLDARARGGGPNPHRCGGALVGWSPPSSRHRPLLPPTPRPSRGGWRRESTVKSPSAAARRKMGSGSSSYRPKAIYLDIDGRIQKVTSSPSSAPRPPLHPPPRRVPRPPVLTPSPAVPPARSVVLGPHRAIPRSGPSLGAGGRSGGWGNLAQRRRAAGVGVRRLCVRASWIRAAASDNFGWGRQGSAELLSPRAAPPPRGKGRPTRGYFFPLHGQSFLCNKSHQAEFVCSEAGA